MLQAKVSTKPWRVVQVKPIRLLIFLAAIFGSAASPLQIAGQTPGQILVFPTSLQWNKQAGVNWHRLQIGGDETFLNIFYDRRVFGSRYTVSNLPPGYYYWRIAPAEDQLGPFSRPARFFVSGGVVTPVVMARENQDQIAVSRPDQRR